MMNKKTQLPEIIAAQGILPLYFHEDAGVSVAVLEALYRAGIRVIEYTNRGENALQNFKVLRRACDAGMRDMYLGIGTIKNRKMADLFRDEGADFIVSPGLIESVAEVANSSDMLWVPGCMTPSEIILAESMGAVFIKLFPANLLGPEFMFAIRELFHDLKFMPTGGVDTTKENLSEWFKSGVSAVGMGSKLITKAWLESGDFAALENRTKELLQTIREVRS